MEVGVLIRVFFVAEDSKLETINVKSVSDMNLNLVLFCEMCPKLKACGFV